MNHKNKCKDYVKALALKHNLSKEQVNALLVYFMSSMADEIETGNDIRIPKFAHIYFDKQYKAKIIINNFKERQENGNE